MNVKKMTLEKYHKKYPARPGDSAERFYQYEKFCHEDPDLGCGSNYFAWYARLARYMESWERRVGAAPRCK